MSVGVQLSGAETTDVAEWNAAYNSFTNNATNPKTGNRCWLANYTNVGTPPVRAAAGVWTFLPVYRNWALQIQLRLEGTPTENVVIFNDGNTNPAAGDVIVEIDTARKIKVTTSSGSTTGATVLNTAQYYQIEARVDKTGE